MLRQRAVVLRVVALRSIALQGTTSNRAAEPPERPSSISAAREKLAGVRAGQPDISGAGPAHHSPAQTSASRKTYGKEGYNFVEHLRISGPGAALGGVRWTLSFYVLVGSAVFVYIVCYLTTYTYVLTTNPAPYRNTLFHHFPCDLAIVENRFTLTRHVVEVTPAITPLLRDDDGAMGDSTTDSAGAGTARFVRPAPAIVERRLHVNALLHRVYLYLQKSHSVVLVNAQSELSPHRFMSRANSIGQAARAPVGFLREDQLLLDPSESSEKNIKATPQQRQQKEKDHWWSKGSSEGPGAPSTSPSSTVRAGTTNASEPTQVYIESEVRLRDAMNGYQKGHLYTYEQTMMHIVQEKLGRRFYAYVLERGMAEHQELRKVYAEEMIRNGLISGAGVTLSQLVPDTAQFADEVFDDLKEKLGDDVIVYRYSVQLH